MVSWLVRLYFLRNMMVELDDANPHCPVTP